MDPKRKKIYIVVTVVCFTLSAGFLFWSYSGSDGGGVSPSEHVIDPNVVAATPVVDSLGSFENDFSPPVVFPSSDKFNIQVLSSPEFTKLVPYSPVDVANQLGRPDPFRNY